MPGEPVHAFLLWITQENGREGLTGGAWLPIPSTGIIPAMSERGDVTRLIAALSGGDRAALDALMPRVYDELRHLAHQELRREREGHTLATTDLVHEVYLKLARVERFSFKDRSHFFAVCAQAMRRILVNYALKRKAAKRGGTRVRVPIDDVIAVADPTTSSPRMSCCGAWRTSVPA